MFLEERRGEDGRPFTVYHFTDPANEREFIRRLDEWHMPLEQAFWSMCQCESQVCLTHGHRIKPGIRHPDGRPVVFDAKAFGGTRMIGEVRGANGQPIRSYIFTVEETQREYELRLNILLMGRQVQMGPEYSEQERGMLEEIAYESMCQCRDQRCTVHGPRLEESEYKSDS